LEKLFLPIIAFLVSLLKYIASKSFFYPYFKAQKYTHQADKASFLGRTGLTYSPFSQGLLKPEPNDIIEI
jgi:hypothetical protein